MNKDVKLRNADNGLVDMTDECILSGVKASTPELICTKYPETCTDLLTDEADCKTSCCDTAETQGL